MKTKITILLALVATILITSVSTYASHNGPSARTDTESPEKWTILADDVTATVYNAVPEQGYGQARHTASMHRINHDNIEAERIIAMERTMMSRYNVSYGDVLRIENAGDYDGIWRVEDTMNKRFAGQNRIDFLVPNHIKTGKWTNVRIYAPADENTRQRARAAINI